MNLLLIDHEDSFTYNLAHLLSGFGNLEVKNFYDIKEKSIKIATVFIRATPIMEILTGIMIAILIFYSGKLINAGGTLCGFAQDFNFLKNKSISLIKKPISVA